MPIARTKSITEKIGQLNTLVAKGGEGKILQMSGKTSDEIDRAIRETYPDFFRRALTGIFSGYGIYSYFTGEMKKGKDFWVKDEWMDISLVASIEDGKKIIQIIEHYLTGEFGHMYSPMAGIKRTPMKNAWYPKILVFYHQLCEKYSPGEGNYTLIKEAFLTGFSSSNCSQAIDEYCGVFGCNREELYQELLPRINRVIGGYIELQEQKQEPLQNTENPIALYFEALARVKEEIEASEARGDISEYRLLELGIFLNEIGAEDARSKIGEIRRVCLSLKDYKTYSHFCFLTSDIGKLNRYHCELNEIPIGYIGEKEITALMIRQENGEGIIFFDENNYINLNFEEMHDVTAKTDLYTEIAQEILPKNLGEEISLIQHEQLESSLSLHEWYTVKLHMRRLELRYNIKFIPSSSNSAYFKIKGFDIKNPPRYSIGMNCTDYISMDFRAGKIAGLVEITNLIACSDGNFASLNNYERLIQNIKFGVSLYDRFINHLNQEETSLTSRCYNIVFVSPVNSPQNKEKMPEIYGKFPDDWYLFGCIELEGGKRLYYVLNPNGENFERIIV